MSARARPRYASVVLDVDSTLAGIEGIDWLAARRGPEIARQSREHTRRAMRGELPLDAVYGQRLALIRPDKEEIAGLARAYAAAVAPHAPAVIAALRDAGVRLVLVSGGLRPAIAPMARALGFGDDALRAVDVYFDGEGAYAGYEADSPLATEGGKLVVVRDLALDAPILAVGDGATDLAARPAVDAFAAYTGFVAREPVVRDADLVIDSFTRLQEVVLA